MRAHAHITLSRQRAQDLGDEAGRRAGGVTEDLRRRGEAAAESVAEGAQSVGDRVKVCSCAASACTAAGVLRVWHADAAQAKRSHRR